MADRRTPEPAGVSDKKWKRVLTRAVAIVLMVPLLGIVFVEGRVLYAEWSSLRRAQTEARESVSIGYEGISPNISFAAMPAEWIKDEADTTLIWAGWKKGVGHRWFRVKQGEIDVPLISAPVFNGSDVVRAIDRPLVEIGGGPCWERIPGSSLMVPLTLGDLTTVYPMLILKRVMVVNDQIGDQPVYLVESSSKGEPDAIRVYLPAAKSERATFGVSGYLFDHRLLLFDRETESLWTAGEDELEAIAGRRRGTILKAIDRPEAISWDDCLERFPGARLIVGADRSKPSAKE